ncbi:MAG TPA: DNA-directed RNA polymerase subunit K [Nanoarchaeota archaeon]|nr:DNA-directed RNA polymerase subunit K [Nanoarchaeota archaeon]
MTYTKFEIARIIGARALQLAMGAPLLIKKPEEMFKSNDVAKAELEAGILPITIRRPRPHKIEVE